MKTRLSFMTLALAALGLASCGGVVGNGQVETETRHVQRFDAISLGGSGSLSVHRGDFKVEVSCDANILPYILTEVVGTELQIGVRPGVSILSPTKLHYEVSLPELSGLKVSGSGRAEAEAFSGKDVRLTVSGSGDIAGDFAYERADVLVSGSGSMRIKGVFDASSVKISGSGGAAIRGSTTSLDLATSGSGHFDGKDFAAQTAQARCSGSGGGEIRAATSLDARLSGSGRLSYWGNPQVEVSSSGSGRLRRAGD